ncbi:MAG: PDZ domain-containing protein [Alphaproteobacteria bacterium]|nr:PDZ domain-containing protein [Alphaproteobacteria bacterium]
MNKLQGLVLAGAGGFIAALIFVAPMTSKGVASTDTYRQLNLFGDVFERVKNDYVREVPDNELVESAINGMLASLDPHSSYMNPKNFADMQVQTRGEFGGLGLEVTMEDGLVKVISPMDGTPAARAGIKSGDLISTIDGQQIQGLTLSEAVDKMRGPANSQVHITVIRKGEKKPLELTLTRAVIRVDSVRFRADHDVAYIRITTFNEQTEEGLAHAVDQTKKQIGKRLKGIVLDLRNNPGGLLDQAISVSDAFLDQGEVVSTRGRRASDTQRYNARSGEVLPGVPMIVLINEGSASASEIVAGALQDHKRARLLGMRSFGKGSVQTVIPLSGGTDGALRLTTAKYYTPSGRSIQATGIDPDIEVWQTAEAPPAPDPRDIRSEADLRNHLEDPGAQAKPHVGPIVKPKPGEKIDDFQLQYAERLLRGQEVVSMSTTTTAAPPAQPN